MAQGVGLVSLLWLWLSRTEAVLKRLFSGLIGSLCLISIAPYVVNLKESNINIAIALLLMAFFWLPVIYWRLIHHLTAAAPQESQNYRKHVFFPVLVSLISAWLFLLPEERSRLLFLQEEANLSTTDTVLLVTVFLLFLSWLIFSLFYVIKIARRMSGYRQRLPELFSNLSGKDLRWVDWQGALLLFAWLAVSLGYADIFGQTRFLSLLTGSLLLLLLMLVIAIWGITQSPVFASVSPLQIPLEVLVNTEDVNDNNPASTGGRYQNSALTEKDIAAYKQKLVKQMAQDIYLDPELTMPKLASQAGVPAIYVSQTLSEAFNCNFYQFINGYRIRYAQKALRETDNNVLNIALASGFNTRSAFYNAFKQITGVTPSQYRLKQQSS